MTKKSGNDKGAPIVIIGLDPYIVILAFFIVIIGLDPYIVILAFLLSLSGLS